MKANKKKGSFMLYEGDAFSKMINIQPKLELREFCL